MAIPISTVLGRVAAAVPEGAAADAAGMLHSGRTALNRSRAVADWLPDQLDVDAMQRTLAPLGFTQLPVDVLHATAAGAAHELASASKLMTTTSGATGVPHVLARASSRIERAVGLLRPSQVPFEGAARPTGVTVDVAQVRTALDEAGSALDELFGSDALLASKTAVDRARGISSALPPEVDEQALATALQSLGFRDTRPVSTVRDSLPALKQQLWSAIESRQKKGTIDDLGVAVLADADMQMSAAADAAITPGVEGLRGALDGAGLSWGLLVRGNRI